MTEIIKKLKNDQNTIRKKKFDQMTLKLKKKEDQNYHKT